METITARKNNLADIPTKAMMERYLYLQSLKPAEPVLERLMLTINSHHDFAACFLAIWERDGKEPVIEPEHSNAFIRASLGLAQEIRTTMQKVGTRSPGTYTLSVIEKVQWRLTTSTYDHAGGASFIETPPSDEARREAVEARKKDGSSHVGARMVRKRERCQSFDQRFPKHW